MQTREIALGEEIRLHRERLGLSRRAAAKRAGLSESVFRQIEKGVRVKHGVEEPARTTPETLAKIAFAVQMDKEEILKLAGFPPGAADVVDSTPSASVVNIIDLNEFPEREAELIRAFTLGLRLNMDRKVD
ncbi:helix-turn-helix domain-containing protein [Rhodococcus sp. NPDC003994]